LKKRSAASDTDKPLEGFVFFVEESLGKRVAEALSQNGFQVVLQGKEIPTGLKDPELFAILAEKGYVVLSKDYRTRYRRIEKGAIVLAELAVFQLARGQWNSSQMAAAFIAAKRRIGRHLRKNPRPFIVRLGKNGVETASYSSDVLRETGDEDEVK
jgi:hypothetical protein